ncbi:DUF11 domain-containing protein [bacterium]|nr:DUF11 domain-containing protein [bacterium]
MSLAMAARSQTPAGTSIRNTAVLEYNGGRGVVHTLTSDEVTIIVGEGALRLVKSAEKTEVGLWDTLVYTFEIQNIDHVPLTNISVRDTLPRMLRVIHTEPSALVAGNTVEWQIPLLATGETRIHKLSCQVKKTAHQETFKNSAVYSADGGIRGRSNRVSTTWLPWPEAVLEKSADLEAVYIGDTLTYFLSVANTGPMPLSQIQVADSLPDGFQFLDASSDIDRSEQKLIWNIETLAPGTGRSLSFRGIVTADVCGDTLHNTASLSTFEGAQSRSGTVTVCHGHGAGLEILKLAPDSVFWAGDTLTYDLILTSSGVRTGRDVTVLDTLPPNLAFVSATHQGHHHNQIVSWHLGDLPAGYHDTLRVAACVRIPIEDNTTINNEVWARTAFGARDSSSWEIRVHSKPDASLKKTVNLESCSTGDTLTYTLQVRHTGTTPEINQLTVTDTLPAGLSCLNASQKVDTTGGILSWHINRLGYQKTETLEFKALVNTQMSGQTLRNTAVLTADGMEEKTSSAESEFHGNGVGIEIIKEAADSLYNAGDTLTYDLILSNGGLRAGHSIVVKDTLPDALEYLASTHKGMHKNQIVTWRLGDLESGYHDTLRVTVSIRTPVEDQTVVNNEVWAYASQGAQDSSNWRIVVTSLPELVLKIDGPSIASPGDTITYRLIYSNIGTATAFEPVVRDTLPDVLAYVDASGEHIYISDAKAVHWHLPPLSPGDQDTLYLYARVHDDASNEDEIVNSAWLSYKQASRVAIATCVTETVPPGKMLFAYITVDKKMAAEYDTLTYCITYGSLNRDIQDTVHVFNDLPYEVEWIDNCCINKLSAKHFAYDPVLHSIHYTHIGLRANQPDSICFKTRVRHPILPGVQLIENQALVYTHIDTARTVDDPRTDSVTRLIKPFIEIKKTVNRKVSQVGDILSYTVTIRNKSSITSLNTLTIHDLIPEGFRYQKGTSILDSIQIENPQQSPQGKRILMRWDLNTPLKPEQSMRLKYRLIVGLSTRQGEHENLVSASGVTPDGFEIGSDEASAAVLVRQGAFDERGFIFGKVYEDLNLNGLHDRQEPQLENIELIMEDGTRVKTDEFGKYSIPNVEHGQHVLRLNEHTLPKNKRVLTNAFEHLEDPKSQLIMVPPGHMVKANFAVETTE